MAHVSVARVGMLSRPAGVGRSRVACIMYESCNVTAYQSSAAQSYHLQAGQRDSVRALVYICGPLSKSLWAIELLLQLQAAALRQFGRLQAACKQ